MSRSKHPVALVVAAVIGAILMSGCNRAFYREQADMDVACMVAEKSTNPAWALPNFNINIDPRSRYYDPYDPDSPPMPPDDPELHRYMHCVDGKKGWPLWHANGDRSQLENPYWRMRLNEYAPINDSGEVVLTLDSALQIAYVNSPSYQETVEEVYLSALDVTTERFRFQTQFFGGTDTLFRHTGRLRGGEINRLTQSTDFELRRRFATAGELVVGIANEFVWQFAGPDTNSVFSLLNFSFLQPLLRGAGRDVALETLTIVERALLANLRAFAQYRQGFFTGIAIGDSSVAGPRRRGGFFGGTGLSGFTGQGSGGFGGVGASGGLGRGFGGGGGGAGSSGVGLAGGGAGNVGGFLGLLQTMQEIRNSRTSLNLQLRTLSLLESSLAAGVIDLTQVDQFRQSIETQRATLLQAENGLKDALEGFKISSLGLPPDVPITLDDSLIQPFQLIEESTNKLQDDIADQQNYLGSLGSNPNPADVDAAIAAAIQLEQDIRDSFIQIDGNLNVLEAASEQREMGMTPTEVDLFRRDKDELFQNLGNLQQRFSALSASLAQIQEAANNGQQVADSLVVWLRDTLGLTQEMSLIQARAKLESVAVEPIEMDADTAFEIALANRFDLMNNRGSLVDTWRLIQFNADALQSNLDVFIEGDMGTVGDNPLNFRSTASTVRAGIRFDAPFTRLVERNNYRQQLIEYQRSRRDLIQTFDGVYFGLRSRLRNLQQLRINLEIQRRATVIAIRRVDLTRETLNEPQPPAQPGEPISTLGPTAAQNLLTAINDLSNVQNNFMSVYLSYYANRMLLARDLGTMMLDEQGRWIDGPLDNYGPGALTNMCMGMGMDSMMEELPLVPPALPPELQQIVDEPGTEGEVDVVPGEFGDEVDAASPQEMPLPTPLPLDPAASNRPLGRDSELRTASSADSQRVPILEAALRHPMRLWKRSSPARQ